MAREWGFGALGSLNSGTMDETLIEVFGCVSLNGIITGIDTGRDKIWSAADNAANGSGMDETLIEIFGCVSFDNRVVWLDAGRERKADRAGLRDHSAVRERDVRVRYH